MNERQFWTQLQQLIYPSEIAQAQWERLVQLHASPPLATQLIIQTVCNGAVYLTERSPLNFPTITPAVSLSANQQLALEMAFSNSAIALIVGSPATGKTRIATNLADAAINLSKRVLLLTHHNAALTAYRNLPGYAFWCQHQDYRNWRIEELRSRHLAQPQMDYLPLHLLPDAELAKLRTPAKLERWLPIIQTTSQQKLTELLQQEFPDLETVRVQLLAYRLKQLEPLLQQQLKLSQLYSNLSEQVITELADQLTENSQVPVLGTVAQFMQPQHQCLWQTTFDLVIVEEAQHLTWLELMLLSGLGQKLVLFGDEMPKRSPQSSQQQLFFTRFPHCFNWLSQHLLPAYRCQLTEQFRLHPEIAKLVYPVVCDRSILTQRSHVDYHLSQLRHRLVWQDVPNLRSCTNPWRTDSWKIKGLKPAFAGFVCVAANSIRQVQDVPNQTAGEQIMTFLQRFDPQLSSQIGIITFCDRQRDWLKTHSPQEFSELLIGTVAEWAGIERAIAIVSCVGDPENIPPEAINIALTRGQEYLILFGDYDVWWQVGSPMRALLAQGVHKERMVVLS